MARKRKKKSFDELPEIGIEKDITAYLEKVGNAVFETFEKYNLPPTPIGEWGLLSQANLQEFGKRMQEIQEQFHQKKIPLPLDLIQAQAILPHLTRAEKSLVQGNCEDLAYHVGSIVRDLFWPNEYQPRLAGQENLNKQSLLTQGIIQLAEFLEKSPKEYKGAAMLQVIEILSDDDSFDKLNRLELRRWDDNPSKFLYAEKGKTKCIVAKSLVDKIYYWKKIIRN